MTSFLPHILFHLSENLRYWDTDFSIPRFLGLSLFVSVNPDPLVFLYLSQRLFFLMYHCCFLTESFVTPLWIPILILLLCFSAAPAKDSQSWAGCLIFHCVSWVYNAWESCQLIQLNTYKPKMFIQSLIPCTTNVPQKLYIILAQHSLSFSQIAIPNPLRDNPSL